MKSVLRHELRWAVPAAVLGVVVYTLMLGHLGAAELWAFPDKRRLNMSFYLFWPPLLGLVTTWLDDFQRTREYRRHRPISARALFWARHLVAVGVLVVTVMVPLCLHLGGTLLLSSDAPLAEPGRLGIQALQGSSAIIFYALAVLAGTVTRTPLASLLVAAAAAGVTEALIFVASALSSTATLVGLVVAALTVAPGLLAVAQRADEHGRDRDLAWPRRTWMLAAPTLVLLGVLTATVAADLWEMGFGGLLLDHYPMVVNDGRRLALQRYVRADRREHEVDDQHRLGAVMSDEWANVFAPHKGPWAATDLPSLRADTFPQRAFEYRGQRYRGIGGSVGEDLAGFFAADGYLHLYRQARHDGRGEDQPWFRRVGKGAGPFAPADRVLTTATPVAVRDADGSVWVLTPDGNGRSFVHHALPGGDRLLDIYPPYDRTARSLFVGQRGAYVLEGDQLRPLADPPAAILASARSTHTLTMDGVYRFALTVHGPAGDLRHQYRPYTIPEHLLAAGLRGGALLRPPVLAMASPFFTAQELFDGHRFAFDWCIAGGDRLALAGNLVLALALGALTFRRQRRLGLPAGRRAFWTVAVALTGLPAYLGQRLIETDRAWRPLSAARPATAAPVLIFKAA